MVELSGVTGSLVYETTGSDSGKVTLTSLSSDDLSFYKETFSIVVSPSGPTVSSWQLPGDLIVVGDYFNITNLSDGTLYSATLIYDNTERAVASITFVAS
jgi:hypothetical protein